MEAVKGQLLYATETVSLLNESGGFGMDLISRVKVKASKSITPKQITYIVGSKIGIFTGNKRLFGGSQYLGVTVEITERYDKKGLYNWGAGKFRQINVEYFVLASATTTNQTTARIESDKANANDKIIDPRLNPPKETTGKGNDEDEKNNTGLIIGIIVLVLGGFGTFIYSTLNKKNKK
jgi:hypothetical protein